MRLIIMFVAIALAAGAFFLTVHFTSKPAEPAPQSAQVVVEPTTTQVVQEDTKDIYTAKQDLGVGTVITPEMLDLRPWPVSLLKDNEDIAIADAQHPPTSFNKMIVRTPFQKGEPIYRSKLANENDPSFLASSLGEGKRLVTVAVDVITGNGGFIFPGDRVDIIATHDVVTSYQHQDTASNVGQSSEITTPVKEMVSEVIIPDVRVLAVNQKTTTKGGDAPIVPANISIEVSTSDAQKIRLVESGNGRLSMLLRSLKDKDSVQIPPPTETVDLSAIKTAAAANPDTLQVTVVRGVNTKTIGVTKP